MGCQKKKKKECELRGLMIDVTRDFIDWSGPSQEWGSEQCEF